MDLYLSNCYKAAEAAAAKAAASSLNADREQCSTSSQKNPIPEVGASDLLDLPLGVKLPIIPGTHNVFYTTNINEKLHQPSYDFNLTDPYCRLLEPTYKSLHDPHLKSYYKRKDILRRLKKTGSITSNNKVVCSLKELNKYRHYLTSLKLDFERKYVREQKLIEKRVTKLYEIKRASEGYNAAQFQRWLLQEGQFTKDEEKLLKPRYLDMISTELDKIDLAAENQSALRMKEEQKRHEDHIRRKLSLRREIEEEWKMKELSLLTKIAEEVRREARVEEYRRKTREEIDRKKRALLEKKLAHRLQKMQRNDLKREGSEGSTFVFKGQDDTAYFPKVRKMSHTAIDQVIQQKNQGPQGNHEARQQGARGNHRSRENHETKGQQRPQRSHKSQGSLGSKEYRGSQGDQRITHVPKGHQGPKGHQEPLGSQCYHEPQGQLEEEGEIHRCQSYTNIYVEKFTSLHPLQDSQTATTEPKEDKATTKTSSPLSGRGVKSSSLHASIISDKPNVLRQSLEGTEKQEVTRANLSTKKTKRTSFSCDTAQRDEKIIPSHDSSYEQQNYYEDYCQQKVTSEELTDIIRNVMTWIVAAVTSILYPVITKYEERVKSSMYPMSADSSLSSESSSCCSTCSEMFTYKTTKTVQAEPGVKGADRSMEQAATPLKPSSAYAERTVVGKTHHGKGKNNTSGTQYYDICEHHRPQTCESDSHLFVSVETVTVKTKDASTETDAIEFLLSSDEKAKTLSEMHKLKHDFDNFKCCLKEETELILENIFQELVSYLTHAISTLSSTTAEVLVDQTETDKGNFVSNFDISPAASEIVENLLEKLQSAVEKKCSDVFSQEDVSVHFKSDLAASGEQFIFPKEQPSEASLPFTVENISEVAEDMVHVILEKLVALMSLKQNELGHLEITSGLSHQEYRKEPTHTVFEKASKMKSSAEPDAANFIDKEVIQNLVSNILSQSSVVGYIKEAISIVLGYIQTGLNNERLIATQETVVILQLLDHILTQLHQKPVKTYAQRSRCHRLSSPSSTEGESRFTSTRRVDGSKHGQPFPPINVPGMVIYSEDENEEINKIVENVLILSVNDEKTQLQGQVPDHWSTRGNAGLNSKRIVNSPTRSACQGKIAFHDCELKTDLPTFNDKNLFKDKPYLNKDIWGFSQDEKHKIQKASENIIISILAEVLKDMSSVAPCHLLNKNDQEASLLAGKPQGLSHQELMDYIFSESEVHSVAHEITDAVLKILHVASSCFINASKHSVSLPVHQTSVNTVDVPDKDPLEIWFESERKLKFLSPLFTDLTKPPWLEARESESTSEPVVHISGKITHTIFKKLKSFIFPKLQICFHSQSHTANSMPVPGKKSSFRSQLSAYATKVVKIVVGAIQKELKHNKKNLNFRARGPPKNFIDTGFLADAEKELDRIVTKLNNDIMISSLVTCICEVLSGKTDKSNLPLPSKKLRSEVYYGRTDIEQQMFSSYSWPPGQKEVHKCARLQVLDQIGETLYDMLCKVEGSHPHFPASDKELNRDWVNENLKTINALQPDIQLISHEILKDIITKLCNAEMDSSFIHLEFKAVLEHIDTDSLTFSSLIEEMSKCSDIISNAMSSVIHQGSQEATTIKEGTKAPRKRSTKDKYPNKLKVVTSDILSSVFAKLEGLANRNFKTAGAIVSGNKSNETNWGSESANIWANKQEELLQSSLYVHTRKIASVILKAIQTALNVSLTDLGKCARSSLQEKEMLKKLVSLILDKMPLDMFSEAELREREMDKYRYRPVYGNFLPGGAGPESYPHDPADTAKESTEEEGSPEEESKSDSPEQLELEKMLKKIEVELKEPQKSPIVPIIRNILNEIFQNDLIEQLNVLTPPWPHLCDIPYTDNEPVAQTSAQAPDKTMDPLVSETDVIIVAEDVIRTIFQNLYSAAVTDRNRNENKCDTVTITANTSFPEQISEGKTSVYSTIPDINPRACEAKLNIGKLTRINVVEDIIQAILTNLGEFASSRIRSRICSHVGFVVPSTLHLDVPSLSQPGLSIKDSYSSDQFSRGSVDRKSGKSTSICQLTASKLNIYVTQVARKILQEIKLKLDKEITPFLTHKVLTPESITSQIANTVLEVVSTRDNYEKSIPSREIDHHWPADVWEKLFNKSDFRKKLQFQILDTTGGILGDICEKTLDENNFSLVASSLKRNIDETHLGANSGTVSGCANEATSVLFIPRSYVAMISNDMVDIVLQNLTSAITRDTNAQDSTSARLSLMSSDRSLTVECPQPPVTDSTNEREKENFRLPRKAKDVQLQSAYSDDDRTTICQKQGTEQSIPDPYNENANLITKAISKRLKSFVMERANLLLTLDSNAREKSSVSPEFTSRKQDDILFLESNQMPSEVNSMKISAGETMISQELTNYGEKHEPVIHVSQASLKEYANIIANTILTLIKKDIDLEIQKMYSYPKNISFQESIILRETINNILKSLHDKISLKESQFYSKQNPGLFTDLAVQNEILPGQGKMESSTALSLFSKCPDQNRIISEEETLRIVLEEIFRNADSTQEKTPTLLRAVQEILKKVYLKVTEDIDHWPSVNDLSRFTSDCKIKTAARNKALQSHVSSVANDIVEKVFRKMFSVVVTALYGNTETRRESEASGSDKSPRSPPCFRELKPAEKRCAVLEDVVAQVYPFTNVKSVFSLETSVQSSPLQIGKELVQKVLQNITDFVLLNLEEKSSPKDWSDEMQSLRPCGSKTSPKGSPRLGFRKSFKAKSKVTSLPKFRMKPQSGQGDVKAKRKTKVGPGEKTLRGRQSRTAMELQRPLSTDDTKNSTLRIKLPTAEMIKYAKDIVCMILETILSEFEKGKQNRAGVHAKAFSGQLMTAREIVNTVLKGLYASKDNLADPMKGSHSDNLRYSQDLSTLCLANPKAHFSLENVYSQLEKNFPKEGILKQMFDKWQIESPDIENEQYKLTMVAETALNEILIKAKELEYSVSLLNLSLPESCESRDHHNFQRYSSRVANSQMQICLFGQEVVEILSKKLEFCFLTQKFTVDYKEIQVNKKPALVATNNNAPTYNTKLKDKICLGSSHRIAQEIVEGVLNTLETFVDLQFNYVSTFSEIVRMPIENFSAIQHKTALRNILPKLQPLNKFPDESKSSTMISQENIEDCLQQLYSFHSELLTYATNAVNDMLGIIKNKLDQEKCQVEPSLISIVGENTVPSQIIKTLIEQCTHFYESLIKSHSKENPLPRAENTHVVNWARFPFPNRMEVPFSKLRSFSCQADLSQIPGLMFYSEESMKIKDRSSNLPSSVRYSAGDTSKTTEPVEELESQLKPSYSRIEIQHLSHFDQAMKGNSPLTKDSVLQKLFQKASASAQEHAWSFREIEDGENQRVFHLNQRQTTISPLKICPAVQNISTMPLSYGLPSSPPHTSSESMKTIKPVFLLKGKASSMVPEELKDKRSLLKIWERRISYESEKETKNLEANRDFTLLEKWNVKSPRIEKTATFEDIEVIAVMNQELELDEIHQIARYVTTDVFTHFKSFEIRGPYDEKASIASTFLRKKYKSKQLLRSRNFDFSLNQLCEHLSELVISCIILRLSDYSGETIQKALEIQEAAFNNVILLHFEMFESRSISIRELALSISEIIIRILLNNDILKANIAQQMVAIETKYIYCPRVAVTKLDDLFQDLLLGVIHVLSRKIGINHQPNSKRRNQSLTIHNLANHNETKIRKRHADCRNWNSIPSPRIDQLIHKNKPNYLACKLGPLVGHLTFLESEEAVNKIFNIVSDLFLPDEHPRLDMYSDRTAVEIFPSASHQQSWSVPRKNQGLSSKSVFLLHVMYEKLSKMLSEENTANTSLADDPFSDEVATECQLFNILENIKDEEFGYYRTMDTDPAFEGYDKSDLLEITEGTDQESMLSIMSHSLVKSLMQQLSHRVQQPPRNLPFINQHLTHKTKERLSGIPKAKRPELKDSRQDKGSVRSMSYDSKPLTEALNNLSALCFKSQAPHRKKSTTFSFLPPLLGPKKGAMNIPSIHNKQHLGGLSTRVYSATFLEEIIAGIFLNLCTSLQTKCVNITESQLNEMAVLGVNSVVDEFNNVRVSVLRDIEQIYFPPVCKETVSKIVDSVCNDVVWEYESKLIYSTHLAHAIASVADQITNSILIEISDYQLPLCFVGRLKSNSYHPLNAENILEKFQNNLRELNSQGQHSTGYATMLSHSFLEDVVRGLLYQLIPLPGESSSLGKGCLMTSDFSEISTCIIKKVMLAISKHKIWLTKYDHQHLYTEKTLQNMVESIYDNILQMSDSLVSIQKNIVSQSPIIVDQMACLIIQEIIETHLQPFLHGEGLPHSKAPLDEISNMIKDGEESHTSQKTPSSLGVGFYPNAFVEEIITRLLSKVFDANCNTEHELDTMTQKIVNSINNHFNEAKICILCGDQEQSLPTVDADTVDELVNSVYKNVLEQYGLDHEADNDELRDSDSFVENISNLIVAAISDYLVYPLFSGDLSASSYATLTAENIVQNISSGLSKSTKSHQHLSPYNTLLPYTVLENIIEALLTRVFPYASSMLLCSDIPEDGLGINFDELSSKLISDIRMKIFQHEIRFSKDEEKTNSVYSEDDAQHLVDSVLRNILQNCGSQETVEHDITSSNSVLIDRIAGFIIKNIFQQHLHPFVYGNLLPSPDTYFHDTRRQQFFASVYSSAFLEDVIFGVLSKIFERILGITQAKSIRDSERELFKTAEELIYLITDEFSRAQVCVLENAEEQLCLPPIERDVIIKIIDMVYSKVLQEFQLEFSNEGFLHDTKTLAEKVTKIILADIFYWQIHPDLIAKIPFQLYAKLNADALIKRVHYDISKSRLQRQTCTKYTTVLSHTHLEKIVTQILSQVNPLDFSEEDTELWQSDFSSTVMKLIDEIMSIISKHAICITKHKSDEQSGVSEKAIQAMVDAIYADICHSELYQSLTRDRNGISSMPVAKIASYIIKEIFNHHLQSFLSEDKTFPPGTADQAYKPRARDPGQRELSFIVNSAVFLEEVISELLCKIFYVFSHNILDSENPCKAKAKITDTVTTVVKSIVLEFTKSQILVADNLDKKLYFSEGYEEMVKKIVILIYEKILEEYKSLIHTYRAIQSDAIGFGKKIYYLLLGEIYDYQVESLVSGELITSYSSLQEETIIRNILDTIYDDSHSMPSCITVLPYSLLEDIIYKLLAYISPSSETATELKEEEVPLNYEFVNAASKLIDEIITEISEHEIRLATTEEHAESMQSEAIESLIDSVCNNITKNKKFQAEAPKDVYKKGDSLLRRIAGFIMKEIMDHHLRPFLCDEESSSKYLSEKDQATELSIPAKEKTVSLPQASVYSATFLEDVLIDLVRKFCTLPSVTENRKDKELSEQDLIGIAINFANALIEEFRENEIKVLAHAEETFSLPPVNEEIVGKISDSVYAEVMEIYGSGNVQKSDRSSFVTNTIAALVKKAMSAFSIQPLFSGDWSSTFFSFLEMDNIIQRVRHLPYEMFIKMNRSLKESPVSSLGQSAFSGLQNKMDRGAFNKKGDFKKAETSVTEGGIHEPICTAVTSMMKGQVTTLASGLAGDTANKKKGDQKNKGSSTREDNAKISKVTPTTTSVRSKDTQEHAAPTVNEIQRKDSSARKYTKGQGNKTHHQHFLPATNDAKNKKAGLELDFKTQAKKKSEEKRVNSLEKEGVPFKLPPLKSKVKTRETRGASLAYSVTNGKQILHPKHLQDVSKGIWSNALGISSFQGPIGDSTSQSPLNDKVACVTKGDSKASLTDFTSHTAPALEEKDENGKNKEANSTPSEPDGPQNQPENNPGILPSGLLEDIISGIVDKLIFSPSEDTDDGCGNVASSINQNQLCDAAMKLIDSLLREFSNAQIKGLNQNQGNQPSSPADKASSVHKGPLRQKEPSVDKAPSEIKMIIRDKIPSMHKMPPASKTPSSDGIPLRAKTPSIDKAWVNKVVHSSVCNILQEYRSQDSVCNDINSNSEHLAKRLANAVIEEIFQHQLNWILYNEVPISVVPLPLESNEFIKKFRKVPRTACKECQTSWPYTIILPREFLESIISSLLSKIFSTVANTKMEISDSDLYTQLDFFQMKLVSTVMTELSKDERMSIQYIESLHPNDDEMIQLVVQTIYNNLLPQFESQESIQNCIIRGCRTITETIVNLVVQEVAGNQLQNYFSGELTPCQCTEVDNVVENILKDVTQTSGLPSHHPSRTFKLPFNIIEEIAVHFLSKLLSFFPKDDKESNKSLNIEMQEIASKILKSFQDYMYESQIEVVAQAKEPPTSLLANSATIEKVVTSVYSTVLKYSGSHISMYKDLMGKSKVLSDIIGFLMVKEISNSEFHPQIEEAAASSSELILETVTIMEKVTKLIDNLKLKENPSSRKDVMLDIMFVEEILALFLARLVKLPSASSKYAKNVSKPELNKIASQLTKSVTAEISRNNINVVAANSEEHFLSPESTEIIPQIVDSVYSHILQQFGTHKDLYYDMKGTNRFFPHKVASLIISTILNCPLETVCSKYSHADLFADVDVSRIVEKTQEHAVKMEPNIGKKELDQDLKEKELPVKIIPHCGKQPVNIDPNIVAEHLGVISIKTQSLKTLKMDCLAKTGHSIEALRRAVISGRRYATDLSTTEERKKEKRVSLDKTGRLNVKPLEIASRNSFRNLLKPDITKVELLKDVQNKKDLIIRLVAHDIDQEESENRAEEGLTSDEDEVVLQEIIKEDFSESPLDGQVKEEDKEPMASTVVALKPPANKSNLKNFLSLGKCCSPRSSETVKSIEASPKQSTEPEEAQQKRIVSVSDVTTSKSSTDTDSSLWKKKRQSSVEEIKSPTEPSLFFLHKLMSASSYNEDDLPSLSRKSGRSRSGALRECKVYYPLSTGKCSQPCTLFA